MLEDTKREIERNIDNCRLAVITKHKSVFDPGVKEITFKKYPYKDSWWKRIINFFK